MTAWRARLLELGPRRRLFGEDRTELTTLLGPVRVAHAEHAHALFPEIGAQLGHDQRQLVFRFGARTVQQRLELELPRYGFG